MTVLYLEALAGIALALSMLMAIAWAVQQRTGNSGWVDTIWTFTVGSDGFDGKLTSSKWAIIEKCSPDTALRAITDLVNQGLQEGRRRRSQHELLAGRQFDRMTIIPRKP